MCRENSDQIELGLRYFKLSSYYSPFHIHHSPLCSLGFFSLGLVEINTYAVILLEADFKFQFFCPDHLDKLATMALVELVYFLALMLLANAFLLDSQFFCHYDEWLKSGENTFNTPTLEWILAVLHHLRNISIVH